MTAAERRANARASMQRLRARRRTELVAQLYDEWQGHYMLQQLMLGQWCDVRVLSRAEALTFRCKEDQALLLVAPRLAGE